MTERNRQTRRDQSQRHANQPKYNKPKAEPYRRPANEVDEYIAALNEGYDDAVQKG